MSQSTLTTRVGELSFDHGLPTPETRRKLYDELDFQRAVQAVLWAECAVNNALFREAMAVAGVPNLGSMIYNELQNPGQETLTPSPGVVYEYARINLKDTGPVVYTVPAGLINAGFFDIWMRPVYDFGIVGPNKGKGDRILLIPPGYTGEIPQGYQVVQPTTYQLFTITRSPVSDKVSKEAGTALLQQIETYPLKAAKAPPKKTFVLMGDPAKGGKEFRIERPTGLAYWKLLHSILDEETVEPRDRITLGQLAALGIEKGQPFAPDGRMQKILIEADEVGKAMMINEAFSPRYASRGIDVEMYPGKRWELPNIMRSFTQEGPHSTYAAERTELFYLANGAQFVWDPIDLPPGLGQKYAMGFKDRGGAWLYGEKPYVLRLPPKVPAKDFWSLTIYDADTRALIETPQRNAQVNPNVRPLQTEADGSMTLYLGPTAPKAHESNWVQTIPGMAWFGIFRWGGPTETFYDKSWQLGDFEEVE